MNRNLTKATIASLAALATVTPAVAQFEFPPGGLPEYCGNIPNFKIYSDDAGSEYDWNDLFGVVCGVTGTVSYGTICYTAVVTQPLPGRIGFWGGRVGSAQDTAYGGFPVDDWLGMSYGSYFGVSGNRGYAKTVRQEGTNAATRTLWGQNIDTFYFGASDRYWVVEGTNDNIRIHLRADVMGDTARLSWLLTNQGPQANIGLEFGNDIVFQSPTLGPFVPCDFIEVPGYRPLLTDHRFVRNPNLSATNPHENPMPPYANFGITQSWAYGLQVPTVSTPAIPDQTPVDILDIGKAGFLLGIPELNDTPMPPATANGVILEDTSITIAAFVQRWLPLQVNQNDSREIVAYYRTTWGVSDYGKPYSAVVDAPKVVAVQNGDPNSFNPNPIVIRVYVDNTRGFASVEKPIPMNDVRITLNLPQGMTDANNPSSNRMVKTIDVVPPVTAKNPQDPTLDAEHHDLKFVDFLVNVDPTLFGVQSYTVTIAPNPGPVKTLTGTINVASQPKLLIKDSANLVTAPWTFSDSTWASILGTGPDPLQINRDFQAFEWDAAQQEYVLQTSPKRGFGNWIISTQDVGFKQLGGNPQTPPDLADGAPLIVLKPGWNLIANPYNYSIPISQIVGVTATDPTESQTFADLANQNIVSSTLSYWDQNTQSYKFTTSFTDLLVPNRGYWVYVNSTQDVTLSFGPVYQAFIPPGTGGIFTSTRVARQRTAIKPFGLSVPRKWRLNLTVRQGSTLDKENYLGVAKETADVPVALVQKPPVSPKKDAVSAAVVQSNGTRNLLYAQSLRPDLDKNEWNWQVYTKAAGSATIAWPNIDKMPTAMGYTLIDLATNKSIDMRKQSSFTFSGQANSAHQFKVVASKVSAYTGPVITSLTAERSGIGRTAPFTIKYQLGTDASTTIRVLSNGQEVRVIAKNRDDATGANTASWDLRDAAGRTVRAGVYVIEVSSTAPGRSTEVKTTSVFVY